MEMLDIDFRHWSRFEKVWFSVFLVIIVTATVYFSYTGTDYTKLESVLLNWVISPLSAISGILCVVLAAKGKISTWTYGVVNCVLYGYLAFRSGYYGDVIINIAYFLPTQFIGLFFWKKRLRTGSTADVRMRRLTPKQAIYIIILGSIVTAAFGLFLHYVDNWFTQVMKRNVSIYSYFSDVFGTWAALIGPIMDAATEGQVLSFL